MPAGPPEKITPKSLNDYLEIMSKSVFQSGMSWKVIENKWPGTKEAFQGFDVVAVADFDEKDIEDLMQDTRVVRNFRKLNAIVSNAQKMLDLDKEHGSFQNYLRSHGSSWQVRAQSRLVHLYLTGSVQPYEAGERVVILSQVLQDPINAGYQQLGDQVVHSVNGERVRNMSDVFRTVDRDGGIRRVALRSIGVDLVLDPAELAEANRRLAESCQIPRLRFQRQFRRGAERPPVEAK